LSPCANQTLVPFQITDDVSLESDPFDNDLQRFVTYVHTLCDMPPNTNFQYYDLGEIPGVKNRFLIDKAMTQSIVDEQLAYLFIRNDVPAAKYTAKIKNYRRFALTDRENRPLPVLIDQVHRNVVSDISAFNHDGSIYFEYVPNIVGGSYNPYIAFKNGKGNASKTTAKLMDLPGNYAINQLTLTYPKEVSRLLVDIGIKETEKRAKKCFNLFFDQLHQLDVFVNGKKRKWVPQGSKLGVLENTHIWASKNPLNPHLHHHCTFPSVSVNWTKFDKDLTVQECLKTDRQLFDDENRELLYSLNLDPHIESTKFDKIDSTKIDSVQQGLEQDLKKEWDQQHKLLQKYERKLSKAMGICSLPWVMFHGKKIPLPIEEIKQLWFDCVVKVFSDLVDLSAYESGSFDVNTKYVYTKRENARQQTLHWIKYTKRSPSLDLNSFFSQPRNECLFKDEEENLFMDLAKLDFDYRDDIEDIDREKHLKYLQDLAVHKTKTRTLGFVRFIKIFRVDPLGREDKIQHSVVDDKPKFFVDCVSTIPYNISWIYRDKKRLYQVPLSLKPQLSPIDKWKG